MSNAAASALAASLTVAFIAGIVCLTVFGIWISERSQVGFAVYCVMTLFLTLWAVCYAMARGDQARPAP